MLKDSFFAMLTKSEKMNKEANRKLFWFNHFCATQSLPSYWNIAKQFQFVHFLLQFYVFSFPTMW